MKLSICMSGGNAIGDGYRDIMNNISNPEKYIVIVPKEYQKDDFNKKFHRIILENITSARFRFFSGILFALKLRKLLLKEKCKTLFLYYDNHWFTPILYLFFCDLHIGSLTLQNEKNTSQPL